MYVTDTAAIVHYRTIIVMERVWTHLRPASSNDGLNTFRVIRVLRSTTTHYIIIINGILKSNALLFPWRKWYEAMSA